MTISQLTRAHEKVRFELISVCVDIPKKEDQTGGGSQRMDAFPVRFAKSAFASQMNKLSLVLETIVIVI